MTRPARSLGDLLEIRDHHHARLTATPGVLGTALGHVQGGAPGLLVFVRYKIAAKWVAPAQLVPRELTGPAGQVCPVAVIESSADLDMSLLAELGDGTRVRLPVTQLQPPSPLDAARHELRAYLRGWSDRLLPGSQLAATGPGGQLREGTLSCFVRDARGTPGFLTNEHVAGAVGQVLYHPTSYARPVGRTVASVLVVADEQRFGGRVDQPNAYYSVDAAFVALDAGLGAGDVEPRMPYLRANGMVELRRLAAPWQLTLDGMGPVGRAVVSVGRTRSFQRGRIAAFGYRWVSSEGSEFFTDYLVVGDGPEPFSAPGDSGKLLAIDDGAALRPVALLWGGAAGEMYLGAEQSRWSYATDLGLALASLGLELIGG